MAFSESPPGFVPAGPSVIFYFTDGSMATLADGAEALRGRTVDQFLRIEVHPVGGSVLKGSRGNGDEVVALSFNLHELPFPLLAVFQREDAAQVAAQLGQVASGIVVADRIPPGLRL